MSDQNPEDRFSHDAAHIMYLTLVPLQKDTKTGVHIFLEDTSANGTFINGEKVGKHFSN